MIKRIPEEKVKGKHKGALFQTPCRQGSAGRAGKKATTNDTNGEQAAETEKSQEDKPKDAVENKPESAEKPEVTSPAKEDMTDKKDIADNTTVKAK